MDYNPSDTSGFAFWRSPETRGLPTVTSTAAVLDAMQAVWRDFVKPDTGRPRWIIASDTFVRQWKRAVRLPRRQIGGCSIRAIKRRAVRRLW